MPELAGARVMVTGGAGFLGSRITKELQVRGADPIVLRSSQWDLRDPEAVRAALGEHRPEMVVHCAAIVGGIGANRARPATFFFDNATMGVHLIHEAWRANVRRLLVVGTVCSYPKHTPVPFQERYLWDGYPEETNAPYGLAKKMLLVQQQAYRQEHGFDSVHVIPTNLYGPGDNFDLETGHVIPAIIRKCLEAVREGADEVVLWGTGAATREFLYVDDAARAIVAALERYTEVEPLNLGADSEISIRDLAGLIAEATGFSGRFVWDDRYPDGQPRRAVDGSRAARLLGWRPATGLREGIQRTVSWYRDRVGARS